MLRQHPERSAIAALWRQREHTEREASGLFAALATALDAVGAPDSLAELAWQASRDELEHASRCRQIVRAAGTSIEDDPPTPTGALLGPRELPLAQRALYTSVAMGCVTESLSTALLLEMSKTSEHPLIKETVHHILQDEVRHARLGWAHLASARGDAAWLSPWLPGMLQAALAHETHPRERRPPPGFGALDTHRVRGVVHETVRDVIIPGIEHCGVDGSPLRAWLTHQA